MNTIKFYSAPPKVVHRISRKLWKYGLPVILISMLWYSCDEETPLHPEQDSITVLAGKDFSEMTQEEKQAYVQSLNFGEGESNYLRTWVDSTAHSPTSRQKRITVRSPYNCGINVELSIYGPADTARVIVYEANTATVVHGPVLMVDNDDFNMTISGAKDYDFTVEPIDNPTFSTGGSLTIDPDWGGKSLYFFHGAGVELFEDFHFECPAPNPDGKCDAEVAIEKYGGNATSYDVEFDDGVAPPRTINVSGVWNDFKSIEIDKTMTYDITITPVNSGSGVYEDYRFNIVRPDQISHFYYMYHEGGTEGYVNDISYFDCP